LLSVTDQRMFLHYLEPFNRLEVIYALRLVGNGGHYISNARGCYKKKVILPLDSSTPSARGQTGAKRIVTVGAVAVVQFQYKE
jgi:hypothetical protein